MDARMSPGSPEDGAATRSRIPRRAPPRVGIASALLVAGIVASVAAGIATCRTVGPYGDGPFGAGFRRLPAAEAGGTILVHDSRVGPDVVRAVIDEGTGRVRELRLAPGEYTVDLAVHARDGRAYDYRRGAFRFTVAESSALRSIGLYLPDHEWRVETLGGGADGAAAPQAAIDWLAPAHATRGGGPRNAGRKAGAPSDSRRME